MKHREVRLTDGALKDIDNAVSFYNQIEYGLGRYFFDSILTDIESLEFFGGLHQQHFGHYASPAKRFPFVIYYKVDEIFVDVRAVLDTRKDPGNTAQRLKR